MAASVVTYVVQLHSGAVHGLHELPTSLRLANIPMSYVRYIGKMVWFNSLTLLYPFPIWPVWKVAGAAALLLLITLVVIIRFRPNPWLAIGWFWYLGMLVPVIGLVQMGVQAMADRYSYLPTIGLLVMLIWSLPDWLFQARRGRVVLGGATLGIATVLCAFTWRQIGYWQNSVTLLTRVIKFSPNDQVALMNLGMALNDEGKGSLEGLLYLRKAVEVGPNFPRAQLILGITLEHYSVKLRDAVCFREALAHLERASELEPVDPVPHNALGIAYFHRRLYDQAMREFPEGGSFGFQLRSRPHLHRRHPGKNGQVRGSNSLFPKGRGPCPRECGLSRFAHESPGCRTTLTPVGSAHANPAHVERALNSGPW